MKCSTFDVNDNYFTYEDTKVSIIIQFFTSAIFKNYYNYYFYSSGLAKATQCLFFCQFFQFPHHLSYRRRQITLKFFDTMRFHGQTVKVTSLFLQDVSDIGVAVQCNNFTSTEGARDLIQIFGKNIYINSDIYRFLLTNYFYSP